MKNYRLRLRVLKIYRLRLRLRLQVLKIYRLRLHVTQKPPTPVDSDFKYLKCVVWLLKLKIQKLGSKNGRKREKIDVDVELEAIVNLFE